MGAVPGGGVLTLRAARPSDEPRFASPWFDVDAFRAARRRIVIRSVDRSLLVLGSTQPDSMVDTARAARAGVVVTRRRSGGGAVLLSPGAQVWADMWVPRGDPLWTPDPLGVAVHVGEWWAAALSGAGIRAAVHRSRSEESPWSHVACFAGVGPGEVLISGRKLVGLAQWRSREGALVFGCAYVRFDPALLVDCLAFDGAGRTSLADVLGATVIDLERLGARSWGAEHLVSVLPGGGTWDVVSG